jgi:hypothetical protein
MAAVSKIRLRRSAAQLHALAKVEREIRATDPHLRRKYIRDFNNAYTSYSEILSADQLTRELTSANIVLVGDYHALPQCQQFTSELIEKLIASGRQVVLGLEMIFARDQRILNDWQAGLITDEQLRHRLRHDVEWGYDWVPLRDLLLRARGAGARIYGLDCLPRGDLRRIALRDRHAAHKIEDIRSDHPEAVIVTLFGESHLAPAHLPKYVRQLLPKERVLTVLQNVDALYWQASGERVHPIRSVRVDRDTVCVFNASPLEKYESYRQCLDRWRQDRPGRPDLAPTFYNLVEALLRFLNISQYAPVHGPLVDLLPELISVEDSPCLPRILETTNLPAWKSRHSEETVAYVQQRLAESGCCYLSAQNTLFVRQFEMGSAAEEAARFVCLSNWGEAGLANDAGDPEMLFYRSCLQHALVEYGSRVLCPSREPVREYDLYVLYGQEREEVELDTDFSYREYVQLIDFIVLHRDFECHARQYCLVPDLIREGRSYTGSRAAFTSRWLGRLLGCELYDAYLKGVVGKRNIRKLFLKQIADPKAAYFKLVRLCRKQRRTLDA